MNPPRFTLVPKKPPCTERFDGMQAEVTTILVDSVEWSLTFYFELG
jgi:hypothetical protein